LDPSQKDFTINRAHATHKAFELVKKELDKCALLCANCHREVHSGIRVLEL
jgi:predicted HNH restriction endonuclease